MSSSSSSALEPDQRDLDFEAARGTGTSDDESDTTATPELVTVECECCCQPCHPVSTAAGHGRRIGRLAEINQEAVDNINDDLDRHPSLGRLNDRAAVTCGLHTVCVGCIRRGQRDKEPPELSRCLAAGADCSECYGPGVRWCYTAPEFAQMTRERPIAVRPCPSCQAPNELSVFVQENSGQGRSVRHCWSCPQRMCFDCGGAVTGEVCPECVDEPAPAHRPSIFFPELDNCDVTAEAVAGRAREMLEDRGRCVRCHHCGIRVAHIGGCKVVTHCGREICFQCNARGQRSSGFVRGCCRGIAQRCPDSRMVHGLLLLMGVLDTDRRTRALELVGQEIRGRCDGLLA